MHHSVFKRGWCPFQRNPPSGSLRVNPNQKLLKELQVCARLQEAPAGSVFSVYFFVWRLVPRGQPETARFQGSLFDPPPLGRRPDPIHRAAMSATKAWRKPLAPFHPCVCICMYMLYFRLCETRTSSSSSRQVQLVSQTNSQQVS